MEAIDTTKPNAGRVYDFYLGGNHNFEVDRAAAEQLLMLMPSARSGALLNRWFMHDAVKRLADGGFACYLDLATGLPTQGYIHDLAPDARVLYNDIDPVTVAYGRTIIGNRPHVRYMHGNVTDIDTILATASMHFGTERRIAVSFIGAAYFFDDTTIEHVLNRLYDWCAPGSQLALSWLAGDATAFEQSEFAALYRRMNTQIYGRTLETVQQLLGRWTLDPPGILALNTWNGVEAWRIPGGTEDETLDLYGSIVTHP